MLDYLAFTPRCWGAARVRNLNQHLIGHFLDWALKGDAAARAYLDKPVTSGALSMAVVTSLGAPWPATAASSESNPRLRAALHAPGRSHRAKARALRN